VHCEAPFLILAAPQQISVQRKIMWLIFCFDQEKSALASAANPLVNMLACVALFRKVLRVLRVYLPGRERAEKTVGFALGCWQDGDIIRNYMPQSGR